MKKKGRRTLEWEAAKRELKPAFQRAGITTCEAQLDGCWRDNGLGFAHRLKRRNITTEEELRRVALLCNACHDVLEARGESRNCEAIDALIAARKVSVVL